MQKFKLWLNERASAAGGATAGKLEIHTTSVNSAAEYALRVLGAEKYAEFGDFEVKYQRAQVAASQGWTKRKDMPVITTKQVKAFQGALMMGTIDIKAPFAPTTNERHPFETGLSGEKAKQWLENGLERNDGAAKDDRIKVTKRHTKVSDLKPIQQQIYFDKSVNALSKTPLSKSKQYHQSGTIYITSADNYIIDGHHRFLSAMLLDPNLKVQTIAIDLPIAKLLPLAMAYGDAIGNKRNA